MKDPVIVASHPGLVDEATGEAVRADKVDDPVIATASQSRLVWRAFRKHRLAMVGAVVTTLLYLTVIFAGFLAPFGPSTVDDRFPYAPPQRVHLIDTSGEGVELGLYVHGLTQILDEESLAVRYEPDMTTKIPLDLFVTNGETHSIFGLFDSNWHLIGPENPEDPMFLLGTDRNGRDQFSRIIYGTRISMTIGLVGVAIAFVLGLTLGGISGYAGGKIDMVIQRLVELFMSIPTLPLWLGLAAALPSDWGPTQRYFAITTILALFAWTELARVARGRFLSLREEEFVTSAVLDGNKAPRLIFRHMVPLFTSHLIASLTLAIPAMILAETALSFLGLGLQAPTVSWGALLQEAQNIRTISSAPWLLLPGVAVVVSVLALNFVGDGLRDAADPYRSN